jgi:RND family efflux transporter MFP subunit
MKYAKYSVGAKVAVVVTAGLLASCHSSEQTAAAAVPIVPVATARPDTLANDLVLTSEFRPYQEVELMAKIAGYVKEIKVDIGDHVKEGDLLAVLEVPEIQEEVTKANAAMRAATAEANIAHLSFQRLETVSKGDAGLVPKQDLDEAETHDLQATAKLAGAQAALAAAQAMMQYATIRAPFSGVVTKRYANVGAMIQAGTSSQSAAMPIVRLAQNDILRLSMPVPVSAAGDVRNGQAVDVTVSSLKFHQQYHITRFSESVQMATRTMEAEADVPNADAKLMPGMYADERILLAAHPNTLSVPLDAVDGLGTSVQQAYVVRDGIVHVVTVETGLQTPTRLEIVTGLKAGDQVIVGRHTGLADGQKVTAKPADYEKENGRS